MATVTTQPFTNPPHVDVNVDFADNTVTVAQVIRIQEGGSTITVRSGGQLTLTAGSGTITDWEVPLDVLVRYEVYQVTPAGQEAGVSATFEVPSSGWTWLSDPAYSSRYLRLNEVQGMDEQNYSARAGVFEILDRAKPIVVASKRSSFTGDFVLTTATLNERALLLDLLSRGQVLLIRTPDNYGLGTIYVHVGDANEKRISPLVTEPTRIWTLPLTDVDRPGGLATVTEGMRWIDVTNRWPDWQSLIATGLTWEQLLKEPPF